MMLNFLKWVSGVFCIIMLAIVAGLMWWSLAMDYQDQLVAKTVRALQAQQAAHPERTTGKSGSHREKMKR